MASRSFSRFVSFRLCDYAKFRPFTHYTLGFSSRDIIATGMYFITPFIFCSRSEPQVIHLYVSLVKDTNIVGISHTVHMPWVMSGSNFVFLKKLLNDFSALPLHFWKAIIVSFTIISENLFSVSTSFII